MLECDPRNLVEWHLQVRGQQCQMSVAKYERECSTGRKAVGTECWGIEKKWKRNFGLPIIKIEGKGRKGSVG